MLGDGGGVNIQGGITYVRKKTEFLLRSYNSLIDTQ